MRFATALVCLLFCTCTIFVNTTSAQTANDMVNIFGGLVRSGIAMATQSAWQQLPPSEVRCVDQRLREKGSSINLVIQQGINPTDPRVLDERAACRSPRLQQSANINGPSFDCAKATYPDERLICANAELSQLDNSVAADFRYVREHRGDETARSISVPSLQSRHACNTDFKCIRDAQIAAITEYQRLGAPTDYQSNTFFKRPTLYSEYVVDGLALGAHVQFGSTSYREYQCRPSDQFQGFTFCQKRREMREARGSFTSSNTILHSADGTAVYINRYLEPAFFYGNEAQADVDGRTKRFGKSAARVIPMPSNSDIPNGMIVTWGAVVLEPVSPSVLKDLADGREVRVGFMIDHIGNLRRSARLGLPIYRLRGGAGYVWAASWNQNGTGTLQFLTADPSTFGPESAADKSQVADVSSDKLKTTAEKTDAERAEDTRLAAEKAAAEKAAEDKAAAERAAAAQAAADKAARGAEVELAKKTELRRKGLEYAKSSGTEWEISRKMNEMTDRTDVKVSSIQKSEEGFVADVEGYCKNGDIAFSVLIVGGDGKPTVNLVGRAALGDGTIGRGVAALHRVNDNNPANVILPELEFNNKLELADFPNLSRKADGVEALRRTMLVVSGANIFLNRDDTWRVMAELKTTQGAIIVKIPLLDSSIQELFQTCQ
jgi:hypothetical protein